MKFYFSSQAAVNHAYDVLKDMAKEVAHRTHQPLREANVADILLYLQKNKDVFTKKEYLDWQGKINKLTDFRPGFHKGWNRFARNPARFAILYKTLAGWDCADGKADGEIQPVKIKQFALDTRKDELPAHLYSKKHKPETGEISCYTLEGKPTASGTTFRCSEMTIAHPTLPFGTIVEIQANGRKVRAMVTDRGPYADDSHGNPRIADLSPTVFKALGKDPKIAGVMQATIHVISLPPEHQLKNQFLDG